MGKWVLLLFTLISITTLAAGQQIDVGSGYNVTDISTAMQMANSGDTILVHPGTYTVDTVNLKSGVSLIGSGYSNTIIYGTSTSGGIAGSSDSGGWLEGSGVSNVEISGFRFTSSASSTDDGGLGESRNCILLMNCSNIKIHNLYFQRYLYNDGVKVHSSSNVQVYDSVAQSVGHDFVEFLSDSHDCSVTNCKIDVQTNTGIRFDNVANCNASRVTIYDDTGSGWCAFEIEDTMTNCVIDHCIVHNFHGSTGGAAVQYDHAGGSLTVSNCVGWDNTGISGSPTTVNTNFDTSPQDENYWISQGYGYDGSMTTIPDTTVITPTIPTILTTTITTTSTSYQPQLDTNIDELLFNATETDRAEPGTGKYQNILNFSATNPNYINTTGYTKSIFWYFPDNFMAQLYGSSILSYQPSATLITTTGTTGPQSTTLPKCYM
jgi:hypothetical protein